MKIKKSLRRTAQAQAQGMRELHGYRYDPGVTDEMSPYHQVRARDLHEIRTQLWMLTGDIDKIKKSGTLKQLEATIRLLQSTQHILDVVMQALTEELCPGNTPFSRTKSKR